MAGMRINRYIASTGEISRRKADELLGEGRVCINGRRASLGDTVDPQTDRITVDGMPVSPQKTVYLAMYKPRNVVTTLHDPQGRPCIRDYISPEYVGVFPIGRLDFDAEGLLLLTNDGSLAHHLHHPSFNVPKTYVVEVAPQAEEGQLQKMRDGVVLDGKPTRPAQIEMESTGPKGSTLRITLKQGLKNQIKRMALAVGLQVTAIKRISMGPVTVEGIRPGEIRELKPLEIQKLHKILK
jgi:23S rRNA pseudouridine2605 synthase